MSALALTSVPNSILLIHKPPYRDHPSRLRTPGHISGKNDTDFAGPEVGSRGRAAVERNFGSGSPRGGHAKGHGELRYLITRI